jgi:peptidoglycan/xylan/chitin deacetylase (PgdA/CDA1 family)
MKPTNHTVSLKLNSQIIAIVFALAILIVATIIITLGNKVFAAAPIIFRLDDVQDGFADNGTKAVLDLFIKKQVPLTTSIIASHIGNDSTVVQATNQGVRSGLFELALHGFRHVDYTTLTPNNQSVSMTKGNTILKTLFGQHPFIFVPPYNTFNAATLAALKQHDMNIISSTLGTESAQNTSSAIYNASEPCGSTEAGRVCATPIHISAGNDFRTITSANITQQTNEQLLKSMAENIAHYGYSMIILHPQDFVYTDKTTGKVIRNQVDPKQLAQLSQLVDASKKLYTPTSMQSLVSAMKGSAAFEVKATTPKVAIITLDDDWIGQLTNGVPILKKYGFNATFFVSCKGPIAQDPSFTRIEHVNDKTKQSPDITTWNNLKLIKSMHYDIQNHGMTHHSLVNQPASVLQQEIIDSKTCLGDHLDVKPKVFAPAYAKPENNQTIQSYITKAGYEFARNGYGDGEYKSPRFDLPTNSLNSLDKKFSHNTQAIVSAFGQEMEKSELPVLVYHNINNLNNTEVNWYNSTTTPETFEAEMKWLHDNGYEVHSIGDLKWDSQKGEFTF